MRVWPLSLRAAGQCRQIFAAPTEHDRILEQEFDRGFTINLEWSGRGLGPGTEVPARHAVSVLMCEAAEVLVSVQIET